MNSLTISVRSGPSWRTAPRPRLSDVPDRRGVTSIPVRPAADRYRRLWNPALLDSLRSPLTRYRD